MKSQLTLTRRFYDANIDRLSALQGYSYAKYKQLCVEVYIKRGYFLPVDQSYIFEGYPITVVYKHGEAHEL